LDIIVKVIPLLSILIAFPCALPAQPYKWVDDKGVVTYSQTPPPGVETQRMKTPTGGTSGGPSSQDKLDQLRQRLADSHEDRQLEKQKRLEEKEEKERKKKNCQAARSNLSKLQGLGKRRFEVDGEYRRLSVEERERLMQKEKEHIKNNCGS
jgi:hypothetical protein